jgi:hypothetical protein
MTIQSIKVKLQSNERPLPEVKTAIPYTKNIASAI